MSSPSRIVCEAANCPNEAVLRHPLCKSAWFCSTACMNSIMMPTVVTTNSAAANIWQNTSAIDTSSHSDRRYADHGAEQSASRKRGREPAAPSFQPTRSGGPTVATAEILASINNNSINNAAGSADSNKVGSSLKAVKEEKKERKRSLDPLALRSELRERKRIVAVQDTGGNEGAVTSVSHSGFMQKFTPEMVSFALKVVS